MIRIGTQGWSYKDWLGNFYPKGTKPADYLTVYAEKFDTVEIDSTFYAIPRTTTVERWYKIVPDEFKFAAKFPRQITHESDLTGVESILHSYLGTMSLLKEKLGPLLIQFPYSFKPDMADNLYRFFGLLPQDLSFVLEIRNRKWLGEELYDQLRRYNIGLALLDHPWMPRPGVVTSNILYVRFLGDRSKIPDDFSYERDDRSADLANWNEFLTALEHNAEDRYFYFNNHYSGHSPTTAERFSHIVSRP